MQKNINYIDKLEKINTHFYLSKRKKTQNLKSHCPFFFISLKRNIIPAIFCIFTVCLVIFSSSNLVAAKSGLILWANNVVPSLLPFFIATELLSHTNVVSKISKILNPIMRPLFNVPGCGAYALAMGIISGYPIGAKIVSKFREENLCTVAEAERLLSFTNNSGPLFIIGTVGISMFGNSTIGMLLFITHILACISVGITFRFWKYKEKASSNSSFKSTNNELVRFSNLGEVLSKSILSGINTVVMIGGFVILFSVVLSILNNSKILEMCSYMLLPIFKMLGIPNLDFANGFISGIIELTNGVKLISGIHFKQISVNIAISSFLLGFGGISILLQVLSITSKSDISIKPYIVGKFLHAFFALIYTILFMNVFPIFNFNL